MKYKLVCIDMDGTLLNSKHKISEETKISLRKAHEKGVHIVITTGRIYNNAAYYSNLLGVKSPVIAANGAFIREKDKSDVIYMNTLTENQCRSILDILLKYKLVPHFHTYNEVYLGSRFHKFMSYIAIGRKLPKDMPVISRYIGNKDKWYNVFKKMDGNLVKAIVFHPNANRINKAKEELMKIPSLEIASSGDLNIEINAEGVCKGQAVEVLAKYYGIKREEVICIGDNENDVSMIEYAGLGVAMGNAIESLKKKANYITDTNDNDGVAKVIEKFILS
ncbi:hypothetical protein SAMN02745163_02710 [Clostridium cavendishii DSM 21758]|uniref:Cof subfamily of IIB subfamily of haloacid dehalogenase superfamily/HAD-superfamily hydrolase, subfamily IIB n=1 Tax=Clostridium cavendishii DSM 21758 TaxID=1121302 RepID=A0A1M6MPK7_9CLOT|nr:Cof-type HAD-IIB family hydrolase [Clostridium cavendishii]SHJ85223.1 hypothetical protein SAMN02745163_02710 [Clostridium cavendishii DSM 21758]